MAEQTAARRMRLLEKLRDDTVGRDLAAYALALQVDERTVRRDVDYLQDLLAVVRGIELRRGHLHAARAGYAPGYFTDQLGQNRTVKEAIAREVVRSLGDDLAIALTAGSTVYYVAREIRRAQIEEGRPRNLIAFTNSLPSLMELIAAGVSTGVLGEVYNSDDCAFYSHDFYSAFQPGLAVVGASGVLADPRTGVLDLFSHRPEEAHFLKQVLASASEIVVAVDATKLGRRHPWRFTDEALLTGKRVRLVISSLSEAQREALCELTESARRIRCAFTFQEAM